MTQRIPDNVVEMLVNPTAPLAAQQAGIDLLSLRAAVRRWMRAEDALDDQLIDRHSSPQQISQRHDELDDACSALRAEMAGIDKDGGV